MQKGKWFGRHGWAKRSGSVDTVEHWKLEAPLWSELDAGKLFEAYHTTFRYKCHEIY